MLHNSKKSCIFVISKLNNNSKTRGQRKKFCKKDMKTLNLFSHSMNEDVTACEGGVIISMQGYNRFQDFYLCVPAEGLYYRAANNRRYGLFMVEVFMDGEFIGATRMDKRNYIKRAVCGSNR